jgi:hypothetical protein
VRPFLISAVQGVPIGLLSLLFDDKALALAFIVAAAVALALTDLPRDQ